MSPSRIKASLYASALAVEEAFYDALQRADHAALMALWSEDEDILCIHPGQDRIQGFEAISASWQSIFEHSGGIAIRPVESRVFESATLSVHCVIEELVDEESHQMIRCSVINVYTKVGPGWRMLVHQASNADITELTAAAAGAILH